MDLALGVGGGPGQPRSRRRARPWVKDGQKTRALSFARRKLLSQDGVALLCAELLPTTQLKT